MEVHLPCQQNSAGCKTQCLWCNWKGFACGACPQIRFTEALLSLFSPTELQSFTPHNLSLTSLVFDCLPSCILWKPWNADLRQDRFQRRYAVSQLSDVRLLGGLQDLWPHHSPLHHQWHLDRLSTRLHWLEPQPVFSLIIATFFQPAFVIIQALRM